MISELKKVRRLPWNGRAENLKATIVTQQGRPIWTSTCVLDDKSQQGMVQRLAAVAVSVWDHTQKHVECERKRLWPMRGAGSVEAPA